MEGELHLLGHSELERLDQLVSDYLLFRSFKHTQAQLFLDKRQISGVNKESNRHVRDTIQRILNALDGGDYPRLLTLWDTYITQKVGMVKSTLIAVESREMEFLANLWCAIYPFRSEIIQSAGTPAVAAQVAARAMTIYKHYLDTKGNRICMQKDHEFYAYRHVHKIAFLPSHPHYKHMFSDEWISSTRGRITRFMEKFFTPTDLPVLCTLFERLNTKSEAELKEIYRRRERKLLKFSRSMYTLSNDLLTALEAGKPVDKAFLLSFRNRFNNFAEVLEPDKDFEDDMGSGDTDASGRDFSPSGSPYKASPTGSPQKNILTPTKNIMKSKIMHKIADLGHLDYASMGRDIAFMSSEVGAELNGLLSRNYLLSLADAAVKSQVAMQGCVLLNALEEYVTRPDKEVQSQASRNSCVTALCRADILGLRSATTQSTFVDISSSSVGLDSRSITRFMFSLAEASRKIPGLPSSNNPEMMLVDSPFKVPPYERLLLASEVVAEHVFRLVSALSSAPAGVSYLHTFGVRLTAAFADYLVSLPHPRDASSEPEENFSETKRGGPSIRLWCLMALIVMTGQSKTNQLMVLKRGGISWLSKMLRTYIEVPQQLLLQSSEDDGGYKNTNELTKLSVSTSGDSGKLFDMVLSLLSIIVMSPEAQRYLVGSLNMQRETESLVGVLILLVVTDGRTEYQSNIITSTLQVLICESSTRELARPLKETTLLRNCINQQTQMSIDAGMARILLNAIDSSSPTIEESSKSLNDISEILESVSALQRILQVNPIFSEYSSGMASTGLSFLLRYTSSAGRIFAGEEKAYEERDGRLRSPPIQVNRFSDSEASTDNKNQHQPPVQPRLPRTPPKSGNPRFISHGKTVEVNEQEKPEQETQHTAKGKSGKRSKQEENDEEEEEEEEEEAQEEEDGDDNEERASPNPRKPKTKGSRNNDDDEEEEDEEEEDD